MSKVRRLRNDINSKLEVIKKIQDDPKKTTDDLYDLYLKQADIDKRVSSTLDGLKSKLKKKNDNKEDIFGSIIDIASKFLSSQSNKIQIGENDKLLSAKKLKKYALESANETVKDSKNIVLESVKEVLFVNSETSICGMETEMPQDSITISPKEFDFLNVLQTDPSSNVGLIMYEEESPSYGDIKMNREFYSTFSNNYTFTSKSGNNLFSLAWDSGNQEYNVSGLKQGNVVKVSDFLSDYYESIENPKIEYIIKSAMLMTLQGDGDNPPVFDKAMNQMNRLCNKLFKVCGSPLEDSGLIQTTSQQFNENDEDIASYFDFDDVEGIDLDDEDARYRKVLRFTDCGNFEVPSPTSLFEDFVHLSSTPNLNNLVDSTLESAAWNSSLNSDNPNMLGNINLELFNMFILNVPKALVSSIISPKITYPFIVLYKQIKGTLSDVGEYIKKLYKLIYKIIKEVFWKFLTEFWKRIKKDLLNFVLKIGEKILKNKYKHYVRIITAIIALLQKLLAQGFNSCLEIFQAILDAIKGALNLPGGKINVPGFLLSYSDLLPGYSADRAYMNSAERMGGQGLNVGTIYGEANEYLLMAKSIVDGISEEHDTNSFIKVGSKQVTIPTPAGPIVIPPGIINSSGKLF
jgi:hypothetical protein